MPDHAQLLAEIATSPTRSASEPTMTTEAGREIRCPVVSRTVTPWQPTQPAGDSA